MCAKRLSDLLDDSKYTIKPRRNYELHRKKIASIMHKTTPITDLKRDIILNKYYEQKNRSSRFSLKEKQQAVERENDLILKKIIQVSNRPNHTFERSHSESAGSLKYHTNLINMKRDFDHIAIENQRLVEKIMKSKSNLYQKKMNQAYAQHLRRRQMLTKYEFDQRQGQVKLKKLRSLEKLSRVREGGSDQPTRGANNFSRITEQQNEQY